MNKTVSISIRVNEGDLNKIKLAAQLESYSSYSEYVRRTILIESAKIISATNKQIKGYTENAG